MAYKIYKTGNVVHLVDTVTGKDYEGGIVTGFLPRKDLETSEALSFNGLNGFDSAKSIPFADFLDVNGDAFADFETLYTLVSNFNTPQARGEAIANYKGAIIPSSTPTGTGEARWDTVTAGTYTNFGGVVVTAGNYAIIGRDADGNFSISQTPNISPNLVPTKETKRNIEFLDGMLNTNYFRTTDTLPGYIANATNTFLTAPTAGQIVGRVELRAGTWAVYNIVLTGTTPSFFIQKFKADGTYVGTSQYSPAALVTNPSFTLAEDGYILFNINHNISTPLASLVVNKYDALFGSAQNTTMYGATTNVYNPFFTKIPKVVTEKTDNLLDLSKIEAYPSNGAYFSYTSAFIRVDTPIGTERYVSIYDDCRMYSNTKKLIVEFDVNGTEIASYIQTVSVIQTSYKQHKLNDATTYFHFMLWKYNDPANYGNKGLITYTRLVQELRFNRGKYFTQEKTSDKITHINGLKVPEKLNPLKGKVIASIGDSNMWEYPATGFTSVGSYMDNFRNKFECGLYNFSLGQAGLTDWSDTVVDNVGGYATTSHNNVFSNQIEQMIAKGIVPDIVVLGGGNNDALRSRTQGVLSTAIANYETPTAQDKKTYYGILFWAVKKLREVNPNVDIIFLKPLKASSIMILAGTPPVPTAPPYSPATINTNSIPIHECYDVAGKLLGCQVVDFSLVLNSTQVEPLNNDYIDYMHPTTDSKLKLHKKLYPIVKSCVVDTIETTN